ncbi:GGDEF domain-containing protein [Rhodoligotrophos ferricapiens]|uniref:GGDEF domain-containing protein n=1 Tax=Rhodoligotrophos ferricapiens TaxID=3069264 RepID=UPI00315D603A
MSVDISTIIMYSVVLIATISSLLVIFWIRDGRNGCYLWFSLPLILGALGGVLIAAPWLLPGLWAGRLGALAILLAYGFAWQAARAINDRRPLLLCTLFPPLLWLILSATIFGPYELYGFSSVVRSLIVTLFNGLAAWEFWRARHEALPSRTALFWLFSIATACGFARAIAAPILPGPLGSQETAIWSVLVYNFLGVAQALLVSAFMIAMVRERASLQNYEMALLDPLTGLRNRRAYDDYVARLSGGAPARSLALLALDIDLFKKINDLFGHAVGDEVVVVAARTAESILRKQDMVFRIGGDEMVCLLPNTSAQEAMSVAERLRAAFQAQASHIAGRQVSPSISIGVAVSEGQIDPKHLLEEADAALYRAKRTGRNQIVLAGPANLATEQAMPRAEIM